MVDSLPSLPPEIAAIDLADASVALSIDASTYGLEALYAASYAFIDRAYVLLDRPSPERYRVTLAPKRAEGELSEQLTRLAGELANELLAAAYRQRLHTENRALIESVTMRAVAGAMGPPSSGQATPSLEELEAFDFSAEAFEDPLGIAMSWEEKYGKKTPPKAGEDPPAPADVTNVGKNEDAG
jgi:His-Xaa-Ser system protein HxsD